jgi:hypothetical protein
LLPARLRKITDTVFVLQAVGGKKIQNTWGLFHIYNCCNIQVAAGDVAENYGYCICVAGGWRQITDTVLVLQAVGGILLILYLCCRRLAAKRSRTRGAW